MPTYIYSNSIDFPTYAMDQYHQMDNQSSEQCTLSDLACQALALPLSDQEDNLNETCLSNSFTAASCCSLHTEAFFVNSSRESASKWTEFLSDIIDGTVSLKFHR